MSNFNFGDKVKVHRVLKAVYLRATDEHIDFVETDGDFWKKEVRTKVEPHWEIANKDPWYDPDPLRSALPVPGGDETIPESGVYRKLRRFPSNRTGVVVGYTYRVEGEYHEGWKGGYDSWTGEWDYEQASLTPHRRVKIYEIAIDNQPDNNTSWPVIVVEAIPEDMEAI